MFICYNLYFKRNWFTKNFTTAFFFSLIALVIIIFEDYTHSIGLLFVGSFLFTLGREIIMDIRDKSGDVGGGYDGLYTKLDLPKTIMLSIFLQYLAFSIFLYLIEIHNYTFILTFLIVSIILSYLYLNKHNRKKLWYYCEFIKFAFGVLLVGIIVKPF
jgi:4-hydroxybenzoate polyprenyltransferase